MKSIKKSKLPCHEWQKQVFMNPTPLYRYWIEKEEIWLRKNIKRNSLVLDVGCGYGKDMKLIVDIAKEIYGIDNNREAIKEIRENLSKFKNVKVFLENAQKMHFRNNIFDYVICMANTFGNFGKSKLKILKEMKRVVKRNGKIIMGIYSEKALTARKEAYKKAEEKIKKITNDGTFYTNGGLISEQFSKERLRNIFERAGLYIKITELSPIFYICEATKTR